MKVRGLIACVLLAACGDNASAPRSIAIVDPPAPAGDGGRICLDEDVDAVTAGIQIDLRITTTGFADRDRVSLLIDGAALGLDGEVSDNTAVFGALPLAEGFHVILVTSAEGDVSSPPLYVFVDSDPPPLAIVSPADRDRIAAEDDLDPETDGIQADVVVDTDVENGQVASVIVTGHDGESTTFTKEVTDRRATVRVTLPAGTTRVRAEVASRCGNAAETQIAVAVIAASPQACSLELDPLPGVLDDGGLVYPIALDPAADDDFQAQVRVRTQIGSIVELELDGALDSSTTAIDDGTGNGVVELTLDLRDGDRVLGALCRDPFGGVERSRVSRILVDTVAPTCAILAPAGGVTLIPDPPGGQTRALRVDVGVSGTGDTDGEPVTIDVGGNAGAVTVQGQTASRLVTLAAPDDAVRIHIDGRDRAGNGCSADLEVAYVTQGCTVEWLAPSSVVTVDGAAGAGVQADLRVRVGPECLGRTVTLTGCATSGPVTAVANDGGLAEAFFDDVTLCGQASCKTDRQCTASVTRDGPITTSLDHTVAIDTQAPIMSIVPFSPSVACGGSLTPADDFDPATSGVQVQLLVVGDAVTKTVDQTPVVSPITVTGNFAVATLVPGANQFVAHGTDAGGLSGDSPVCELRLGTLLVEIDQPTPGALLGGDDGVVSGSNLLVQVCGTVGEPAASSVVVRVDGNAGSDVTAAVDPGTGAWCASGVSLSGGLHVITALASSTTGNSGDAEVTVTVELGVPDPASDLTVSVLDRRSVRVGFTEPADVTACAIKQSNTPITDDAGWDAIPGNGVAAGGGSPGQTVSQVVSAKPGRDWYFAVRCSDAAGNRSPLVSTPSATVLDFTPGLEIAAGAIPGYRTDDSRFGEYIVGADLNGDGQKDLVVSAIGVMPEGSPDGTTADGAVYIYLARAGGITQATPDYVIVGSSASVFGSALTAVDWNHDGVDDIAVGAPFARGFQGEVDVFYGDAGWTAQATPVVLTEAAADVELFADAADPLFVFAILGQGLDRVDFDGDGRDELLIGVVGQGAFAGGALVLFAPLSGAPAASVALPTDLGPATGMVAYGFDFPQFTPGDRQYGSRVVGLGRLSGDVAEDILIAPSVQKGTYGSPSTQSHFVYYGRSRPLDAAPFQVVPLSGAAEELVTPIAPLNGGYGFWTGSIGDQTGDGRRDLVVGFPTEDNRRGSVLIFPGGTSTGALVSWTLGEEALRIDGKAFGSELGNGLGTGGDIDGDLVEDLVTCSGRDGGLPHLYGWFGGEGSAHTNLNEVPRFLPDVAAPSSWEHCSAAAFVGDLNGDGLSDVVWGDKAGERRADSGPQRPQRIQILY